MTWSLHIPCVRTLAATLLLLAGTVSLAQAPQSPAAPAVAAQPEAAAEEPATVVYAAPTRPDRAGRVMAPVFVNGQGPFRFIVDTGASRSVLAPRLAARLGLVADPTQRLVLRGITGTEEVSSILIDRLEAGDIVIRNQYVPVVAPRVFANSDGILGVDGLVDMCLYADFVANHISITEGGCRRVRRDWVRIPATLRFEQLVNIRATIQRQRVHAIIDTGAERSLGNLALLRALSLERKAEDPGTDTKVFGATEHAAEGNLLRIPKLYLGDIGIGNMRVAFGDFEVFRLWDLEEEPAIVVGMDVLGTVKGLMIDYQRAELRIQPRRPVGPPAIRKVRSATRIKE